MSFTQQFEQDSAMGCVCDFDVPCAKHPNTSCGACEYGCHCETHTPEGTKHCDPRFCGKNVTSSSPMTHATYRKEWIADWRANTGDTARGARLAFETMLNQSWAGCTCPEHGNPTY